MGFISACGVSIALLGSVSTSGFWRVDQAQQTISEKIIGSQNPTPLSTEYRPEWVKKEEGDYAEFFAKLAVLSTIPVPYQQSFFSMKAQQYEPRYAARPGGQTYRRR